MVEHPSVIGRQNAQKLLERVSGHEFHALACKVVREWRKSTSDQELDVYAAFAHPLLKLLAAGTEIAVNNDVRAPFLNGQALPWMRPLIDFFAWMVGAGLAIPVYDQPANGYPARYRFTTDGNVVFLADEDHPLLPDFVDRVVARCPGLPEEVPVHLVDARACLDVGLRRPAVSLMGLAYEAAENEAIEFLEKNRGLVLKKDARAAQRIAAVLKLVPQLFGGDLDRQGRARAAWEFADQLRDRRNHASHPKAYPDFGDADEVQEFLVSAGRNLPALWSVTT
jgi:hypothetical protein